MNTLAVIREKDGKYTACKGNADFFGWASREAAWRFLLDLPPAPERPSAKGWNLYRVTPCGSLTILVMVATTRAGLFPTAVPGDLIVKGLKGPQEIV